MSSFFAVSAGLHNMIVILGLIPAVAAVFVFVSDETSDGFIWVDDVASWLYDYFLGRWYGTAYSLVLGAIMVVTAGDWSRWYGLALFLVNSYIAWANRPSFSLSPG